MKKFLSLFVAILCCVSSSSVMPAMATSADYMETSSPYEDLCAYSDGFDEKTFWTMKDPVGVDLIEYGAEIANGVIYPGTLYYYVFNPKPGSIPADGNFITMGINYVLNAAGQYVPQDFYKFRLSYVNSAQREMICFPEYKSAEGKAYLSTTKPVEYIKFRIETEGQLPAKLPGDTSHMRRYTVSGVELIYNDIATKFGVLGGEYTYVGFGDELTGTREEVRVIPLEVTPFTWYKQVEGYDTCDQINSVYFSVPTKYINDYGEITAITAEWYQYRSAPIAVFDDNDAGKAFYNRLIDGEANYRRLAEYDASLPGLWWGDGYNVLIQYDLYSYTSLHVDFGYNLGINLPSSTYRDIGTSFSILPYMFKGSGKKSFVSGEDILKYVYAYDLDKYITSNWEIGENADINEWRSSNSFEVNKRTFPSILFDSTSGDHYHYQTITSDPAKVSVNNPMNWWQLFWRIKSQNEIEYDQIYKLDRSDLNSISSARLTNNYTAASDSLFVLPEQFDKLYDIFSADYFDIFEPKTSYLFRFDNSEFFGSRFKKFSGTLPDTGSDAGLGYIVQEDIYLDFDILSLTFTDEKGAATVVPVRMSPIDIAGDLYSPPIPESCWDKLMRLLRQILPIVLGILGVIAVIWLISKLAPVYSSMKISAIDRRQRREQRRKRRARSRRRRRQRSFIMAKKKAGEKFPHFRRYKKSGHPALILGEEKDDYHFRRVTSSEFSGHHRNEKVYPNPDKRKKTPMYIVKQRQKDKKKFFGKKYPWKYPK